MRAKPVWPIPVGFLKVCGRPNRDASTKAKEGRTPMARDLAPPSQLPMSVGSFSTQVLGAVAYLGGVALLLVSSASALFKAPRGAPRLRQALFRQMEWLLGAGLPLVGLVHVGMGSFLAMQAYYGATFVEAVGPVVGVGLFRNVAPLLTGLTLAGLIAARSTAELARRPLAELDGDPGWVPDRTVALGQEADPRDPPDPARLTGIRIAAAMLVGPVLALWGAIVGTVIGWSITIQYLGVPTPIFFSKAIEMLWARDMVGLVFKGVCFGVAAALFPCYEGLRGPISVPVAAVRAACLAAAAILLINSTWYVLMYMAGPAFGPTVLPPPVP
jgi:phospholipid/cholesterol/gamma-HCH transport system permease protein